MLLTLELTFYVFYDYRKLFMSLFITKNFTLDPDPDLHGSAFISPPGSGSGLAFRKTAGSGSGFAKK